MTRYKVHISQSGISDFVMSAVRWVGGWLLVQSWLDLVNKYINIFPIPNLAMTGLLMIIKKRKLSDWSSFSSPPVTSWSLLNMNLGKPLFFLFIKGSFPSYSATSWTMILEHEVYITKLMTKVSLSCLCRINFTLLYECITKLLYFSSHSVTAWSMILKCT